MTDFEKLIDRVHRLFFGSLTLGVVISIVIVINVMLFTVLWKMFEFWFLGLIIYLL